MIPTISVIIPSSRHDKVQDTVNGLKAQDTGDAFIEVIVVSPFKLVNRVDCLMHLKTIQTDRLFVPGKMRNIGAAASHGEYLAFIDDDCVPPSNWLSALLQMFHEEPKLAVAGCRVVSLNKSYWSRAADYALFAAYQYFSRKKIALGSAAIMFKRSCFEKVNGFDEELRASEDWDMSLKLQKHGWDCMFNPQVEVIHNHGCGTFPGILKKSYLYGFRSRLVVQRRHRKQMSWLAKLSISMGSPWIYWLLIIPYSFLMCILKGVDFIRRDKKVVLYFPILFISQVVYHVGVLNGLIKERRGIDTV
jgi:cellulose synthase/poly-beta-1,6-N-acetylglucosamine synthase-like glycosyltransferase